MTADYIRNMYGVPAKKGAAVEVDGRFGVIVGYRGPHLRVRFHDGGRIQSVHPTWKIRYLEILWESDDHA